MKKIILASQSPRRKQLLEWAEVPFEVIVKETDESYPPSLPVEEVAIHIARQKAVAVQQDVNHSAIILAADTLVVLNAKIMGKPGDREEAIFFLEELSGQKHKVITGVCILDNGNEIVFADSTDVEFHKLSKDRLYFTLTSTNLLIKQVPMPYRNG